MGQASTVWRGIIGEGEKKPHGIGHFFLCFHPEAVTELGEFKRNVGNLMRELKASGDRVLVPRELESVSVRDVEANGIQVPEELMVDLAGLGWER